MGFTLGFGREFGDGPGDQGSLQSGFGSQSGYHATRLELCSLSRGAKNTLKSPSQRTSEDWNSPFLTSEPSYSRRPT
jgi:hypothetical protein